MDGWMNTAVLYCRSEVAGQAGGWRYCAVQLQITITAAVSTPNCLN